MKGVLSLGLSVLNGVIGIVNKKNDAKNQMALLEVKILEDKNEALNIAEEIFQITDKLVKPKKIEKRYEKLRKRFDKND